MAASSVPELRIGTGAGRWVVLATVLGSGLSMLDATVVNIALPTIGRDFDVGLSTLQWVINAYTLTLAGFLLLGGALGDRYGRRRVFLIGVAWFAVASLLCAVAPNPGTLIAARALQGVGAAMIAPGSLAILEASFHPHDRAAAIGAWSGFGGVMTAIGPFIGGWLIEFSSWRWIFLINVPIAAAVIVVGARHVPETRDDRAPAGLDVAGAVLTFGGLAGIIFALTEGPARGWSTGAIAALLIGIACLVALVMVELRSPHPLLPPAMFRISQFRAANAVTFVVYGALSGALFLLPIQLQTVVGFSPLASGTALLPITFVMLAFSSRAGRLATRIGPRIPMTLGPMIAGCGLALMVRIGPGSTYWTDVFPAVTLFGCGLALTVAPLTATALAAAGARRAGVAAAVNSDVARAAGLVAVALLPLAAGITNADFGNAATFSDGFQTAMLIAAGILVAGGALAFVTIRRPLADPDLAPVREAAATSYCALDAPPMRTDCAEVA